MTDMVRKNYTYCNTPEKISQLVAASAEYADILSLSRERAEFSMAHFADRPDKLSGWAHDFVCPDCAAQLNFDIARPWDDGSEYTCPVCGKTVSGAVYDEAWVYYYRYDFAESLADVALQALLGDSKASEYIISYMDFYSEHYSSFPLHGTHAGKGCIMSQGLDEAVFAVNILRALKVADSLIPEYKKASWLKGLFMPLIEVLRPQINSIHNISCWMKTAIGMTGLYFKDDSLLEEALGGEYGIIKQIENGYTSDGIWYEGSLGYHFYTAECLTYFFSFYAEKECSDPLLDRLESIYTAPLTLSYNGHALCALNDGWYPLSMPVEQTAIAARIVDSSELKSFLRSSRRGSGVWRLLLDTECEDGITLMADTRLAVFHRSPYAILKGSVLAVSHMHQDVLSLRLPPYSDDIGTPGYAHPMTAKWYRTAQCHNTVLIDGQQPNEPIYSKLEKTVHGVKATAEEWKGVRWSRCAEYKDCVLYDTFRLESENTHDYTWFFHVTGELIASPEMADASLDGEAFTYFKDVKKICSNGDAALSFAQQDGKIFSVSISGDPSVSAYLAKTPGNPANRLRNTVVLRCREKSVSFKAEYTVE